MNPVRVLVIDDEESIRDLARSYLEREGFRVETARDGPEGLSRARVWRPDIIVLDIMLPGMDGLEVLRQVRQESQVYVILLTAKAEETDKIVGLSVGADDYVTKPFSPRELAARLRALMRRARGGDAPGALVFRHLRIDPERREVRRDGEPVELTAREFDLLLALATYPGRVLTRERLIERVWGPDYFGDERVVDVHVKDLRRKLGEDAARSRWIQTVRGVGYRFGDTAP